MIQIFSMEHGAFWFMDASLFKNADFYEGCLDNIKKRYLVQMKISSRSIPRNILSLLSLLCGNIRGRFVWYAFQIILSVQGQSSQKQVAREFGLPQYTYLESWIRCITVLRNCCAHHARIWNRRFALKPQLPNRLPLFGLLQPKSLSNFTISYAPYYIWSKL